MNATTDDRSATDLEREGEQIRADLDRTLDEIQQRLSPVELMDRSVEFLRDNGMDLLREAGETVRRNPVPILLTAAGLVWLTSSIVSSRSGGRYQGRYDADGNDLSQYRAQSRGSYSHPGYGSRNDYEDDWDESTHGRVSNAAHKVKSTTRQMKGRVQNRLSNSMDSVRSGTHRASSHFNNLVQEQPVALGAIALAAGALLGAAIPMTRYENRMVGPIHDRTMARAKEVGQREYENIREAVASRGRGERQSRGESSQGGSGEGSSSNGSSGSSGSAQSRAS